MDSAGRPKAINSLAFFATEPHPCSYLEARTAVSVFADPSVPMNMSVYSRLADYGFRRSGSFVYTPSCPGCQACLPLRIPVDQFQPNRSQRRSMKRNADLDVKALPAAFHQEHFDLYCRYLSHRHPGSSMENPSPAEYLSFLGSDWSDTWFYEFRDNGRLVAVSVADHMTQGLSAVYTFYEPDQEPRGLGTYAILWLLEETRSLHLKALYLGYWIAECEKMQYKARFQPCEIFANGRWIPLSDPSSDG
ncbi:MAG: arginyltransferase [Gammaproteobacteria bacterium]|jgi:arginine-tRNA-protein transferase